MRKECVVCGNEFEVDSKHSFAKACSRQCNVIRQRNKRSMERARVRPRSKRCIGCGCEFNVNIYNWHVQVWCSECKKKAIRRASKKYARSHPRQTTFRRWRNKWNGNWYKAMFRDDMTCQICGKVHEKTSRSGPVVHHVDFSGETNSPNHRMDNLQVLCGSCHSRLHKPQITVRVAEKQIAISGLLFQVYPDFQVTIEK